MPARVGHPLGHRAACRFVVGAGRYTTASTSSISSTNNRCALRRGGTDTAHISLAHIGGHVATARRHFSSDHEGTTHTSEDTTDGNAATLDTHDIHRSSSAPPSSSEQSVGEIAASSGVTSPPIGSSVRSHSDSTATTTTIASVVPSSSVAPPSTTTRTPSADRARTAALRPAQSVSGADLREMHKLFVQKQLTVLQQSEKSATTSHPITSSPHSNDDATKVPTTTTPSPNAATATSSSSSTNSGAISSSSSVSSDFILGDRPDWKTIFSKPVPQSLLASSPLFPIKSAQAFIAEVVKTVVARSPSRGQSPSKSSTATSGLSKKRNTKAAEDSVTLCPKIAKAIRRHERLRIEAIKRCTADIFLGLHHMPPIAVRQLLKRGITNKTIAHYIERIEQEETRARKQAYIKSQCRRIEDIDRNLKDRGGLSMLSAADPKIAKWKASLTKAQKLEVRQLGAERARVVKRLAELKAKNDELVAEIEELESENIAIVEIAALDARDWCKKVDKQQRQKKRADKRRSQIKPNKAKSD